ncbi:MAG: hypothetical protein JWR38_658 [Mucilaginibacter sp.]|nr:hypothetical protein [Mucilaginibacter sp.]
MSTAEGGKFFGILGAYPFLVAPSQNHYIRRRREKKFETLGGIMSPAFLIKKLYHCERSNLIKQGNMHCSRLLRSSQ